jgi:hypothetical protein
MIKLKLTVHGINKGREVMEWNVTPENCAAVASTINNLLVGQLPRTITKIEMTEAPTNGNKAT